MATSNTSSFFKRATGQPVKALWMLRGFSMAILITLLLAMFVFKSGTRHDFCLGMGVGILIGLIAQLFAVRNVEVTNDVRPSGVDQLTVTR